MRYSIHSIPRSAALLLLVGVIFLGCNEAPTEVMSLEAPDQAVSNEITVGKRGPVVQSVTGSGNFTTGGGNFRTFTFTARRHADGTVTGQWQRVNHVGNASESKSHGQVTCFTIIDNQAWIGGFATSGLFSTPPNNEVATRVVDNGEGSGSTDQISLQFVGAGPGFAAGYCGTTPTSPALNNVAAGNIQVRP